VVTRVCVSVCLCVRGRTPTLLHGPGCNCLTVYPPRWGDVLLTCLLCRRTQLYVGRVCVCGTQLYVGRGAGQLPHRRGWHWHSQSRPTLHRSLKHRHRHGTFITCLLTATTLSRPVYRTSGRFCNRVKNWRISLEQSFTVHVPLRVRIREKMLELSSTLLPAPSPYHHFPYLLT